MIHANNKPHKCGQCSATFNRQYNLRRHMKAVHNNLGTLPPVNKVPLLDVPLGMEYVKGAALTATSHENSPGGGSVSPKKRRQVRRKSPDPMQQDPLGEEYVAEQHIHGQQEQPLAVYQPPEPVRGIKYPSSPNRDLKYAAVADLSRESRPAGSLLQYVLPTVEPPQQDQAQELPQTTLAQLYLPQIVSQAVANAMQLPVQQNNNVGTEATTYMLSPGMIAALPSQMQRVNVSQAVHDQGSRVQGVPLSVASSGSVGELHSPPGHTPQPQPPPAHITPIGQPAPMDFTHYNMAPEGQ